MRSCIQFVEAKMHPRNSSSPSPAKGFYLAFAIVAISACAFFTASAKAQAVVEGSSSADYANLLTADANADPGGSATPAASPQYGGGRSQQQRPYYHGYRSHMAVEAGAGFNAPVQDTERIQKWGWNATGGLGYSFSKEVGVMAEYQFVRSGIPDAVLAAVNEPGGNIHTWSLTLDPIVYYKTSGSWGGYVTGGGGFYRRLTSFTQPVQAIGQYCDYFTCYPYYYTTNVVVGHYSSNQGGLNIGTGLTFGHISSAKFYAEARYTWLNTPGNSTQFVPVTFGVRW